MSLRKPLELQQVFLPRRRNCSGRLTWDVFVRNLTRQLGTPSHWLPVDSCKEGQKGALAAVCTPTVKSASKNHQNSTPPYRSTVNGTLGGQKKLCIVYIFSFWQTTSLPSPLCVASRLEQATRMCSRKVCQKFQPRFPRPRFYLNYSSF